MSKDWTNQEPTPLLPSTFWGKVALWLMGLTPVWILAALVLTASVCGWE